MSRHGTLLALPGDTRLLELVLRWPNGYSYRSEWLHDYEQVLREHYPFASSADLRLTARHHAPFPLALGGDVP